MATTSIGLLGKMPAHGDFVRHDAVGPTWKALDEWIQHGLLHAQSDRTFEPDYVPGGGYAFLFNPPTTVTALMGYIHPSRDTIGRHFPIVTAFEVDQHTFTWDWFVEMPLRYDYLLRIMQQLVAQAAAGSIDRDMLVRGLEQEAAMPADFSPWESVGIQPFRQQIPSVVEDDRWLLLFANVIELIGPLKGNVPEKYTLGFRFPATSNAEYVAYHASIWMATMRMVLQSAEVSPSFFWRLPVSDTITTVPNASSLLAFFRSPSPRAYMDILPVERDSDHICDMDLINEHKLSLAREKVPEDLRMVLEAPRTTLYDLLHQLKSSNLS